MYRVLLNVGSSQWQKSNTPGVVSRKVADHYLNVVLSSARIVVEHVLAGVKRCRIVKEVFRNTKVGFPDLVMDVACALHNLRVAFRYPVPTLKLLDSGG